MMTGWWGRFSDAIKKFFGIPIHDKELFAVGNIAFVKCKICGNESFPWQVSPEVAAIWHRANPDAMDRLVEINERVKVTPGICNGYT